MPINKEKKKEIVSDLKKAMGDAKSMVFVNFHGLSVADSSVMRKALRKEDVNFSVAKKTLIKIALDEVAPEGERPEFKGELALAWSDDLLAPARGVYEFQKKFDGKISILGGVFEKKYMSAIEMLGIASIPPLDALRGMFVNIVNSPIQRFAIALGQIAEKKN
ncbi:MAG TPA: 50S ribosomal protein L10 [Candidatus Paceibacterota bacterium]